MSTLFLHETKQRHCRTGGKMADLTNLIAPYLLNVKQTGTMSGLSWRNVIRQVDAGHFPPPVRIGGSVRWRKADIEAWIAAGCPNIRRTGWTPPTSCNGACAGKGERHE
jgi:prophage regulatory protein